MARLIALLALAASSLCASGINNKWFVVDAGSFHNSEVGCFKPANVSESPASGLTITAQAQSVLCGDSSDALSSFAYTTGTMISNSAVVALGDVVAFQVTTPAGQATGLWPTVWFQESNCPNKLGWTYSALWPSCSWPQAGSEEFDAFEMFGGTSIDQELHYYNGGATQAGCSGISGAAGTTYTVTVAWTSGSLVATINGTTSCTITNAFVPSGTYPMYIVLNFAIGGASGSPSGVTFPQTVVVRYVRVCPPGTTASQCSSGSSYATVFDDEFTGTSAMPSVYVGQNFTGNATGLDCADSFGVMNNQQLSWINDSGYWSDGQIGPGTTITTCGTITTPLIAWGSGTSGSPVTLNNSGTAPYFYPNGYSFINQAWTGAATGTSLSGITALGGKVGIQ